MLICVEKHKDKLPHFVNRVPFIIDANGMQILEHNMSHFLEGLDEKDEYDDISAFVSCARGHFGNEFCYVDDMPPKNDVASTLGYVFIDEDDKYQGSEQDMSVNQNKNLMDSKQVLQRDLFDYPQSGRESTGQPPPMQSTSNRYGQSMIPNNQQMNPNNQQNPFLSNKQSSTLPLNLQAQDPRLATIPSQYQSVGQMSYNPTIDLQAPEQPTLPFQQVKVERQKKISDNLVDDLVQQRMNDMKAFM